MVCHHLHCLQVRLASRFATLVDRTRPAVKEVSLQEASGAGWLAVPVPDSLLHQAYNLRDKATFVDIREPNEWDALVSSRRG